MLLLNFLYCLYLSRFKFTHSYKLVMNSFNSCYIMCYNLSGGHHSQDGSTYLNYKLSYFASICIFFTLKRTNWLCTCSSSATLRTLHMLSNCYLRSLVLINNAYCHLFKTTPCIAPSFRLNLFQKFNQKSAEILV